MTSRAFAAVLAALLLVVQPAAAWAAAKDAVLNKEGYWGIDVDGEACAASMSIEGGQVLVFRATAGAVTFAIFSDKRLPRGKTGTVFADEVSFEFPPGYTEEGKVLYFDGDLTPGALASLRVARELRIAADRRLVTGVTLEGTGFAGALDGVIACSKGEKGWWGGGVSAEVVAAQQSIWAVRADDKPGLCTVMAKARSGGGIIFVATPASMSFGVAYDGPIRQGRKGVLEVDGYAFEFRPDFDGKGYFTTPDSLDSQTLFLLRRTKDLRVTVDGREALSVHVEGTGLDEALTAVSACARGEKGPWSAGAP